MNRQVLSFCRAIRIAIALGLLFGCCATAAAQGFRREGGGFGGGPPSPEDMFRRMDANQNGQIDPEEIQSLPGPFREMWSRAGIDGSRPISQRDFMDASQRMREQFERARSNGDFQFRRPESGGGSSGGGGPPSSSRSSESERSEGRRSEDPNRDYRRDERDDRPRDGERRESSSSSSKSSKKTTKPKTRVTTDLPEDYRDKDKNGDGQIGLYEWDRQAFAQFYALDRNGDGLLTPDELIAAAKRSSSTGKSSSSGDSKSSSGSETAKASDTSKTNESSAKKSAVTAGSESSPGAKAFLGLDTNKDGQLSEEELKRSRSAQKKFEKAGIEIRFPIQQAQFVTLYNKAETQ